ncbi:hypothetical protein CJD36_007270 [Flavipsychrobacter stenotrophus]|uniref:Uncharacterized protein n=1 Tax=Flavipsychrobacter stenotrophus TaxID=2077091 RepID=A0A2S7SXD7_9BACT|nr:hypothetical protein CJD36_007270 [Flavipsychrobacter stenotrophus]
MLFDIYTYQLKLPPQSLGLKIFGPATTEHPTSITNEQKHCGNWRKNCGKLRKLVVFKNRQNP